MMNNDTADSLDLQEYLNEFTKTNAPYVLYSPIDTVSENTLIHSLLKFGHVIEVPDSMFDQTQLPADTTVTVRAARVVSDGVLQYSAGIDLARGKGALENEIGPFGQNDLVPVEEIMAKIIKKTLASNFKNPSQMVRSDFSSIIDNENALVLYDSIVQGLDFTSTGTPVILDSKVSIFTVNDTTDKLYGIMSASGLLTTNSAVQVFSDNGSILRSVNITDAIWGFSDRQSTRYAVAFRVSESPIYFGLKFIVNKSRTRCRLFNPGYSTMVFKY